MPWRARRDHILHHAMFRLQDAVDLIADFIHRAACDFVGHQQQFQVEVHFQAAQREQYQQDHSRREHRSQVKAPTRRHAYRGHYE